MSVVHVSFTGCSTVVKATDSGDEIRTKVIPALEVFSSMMRMPSLYDENPDLHKKLNYASWSIGMLIGYDFKSNVDGWDLWISWQKKQDRAIPIKAMLSDDPVVIRFGVDLAIEHCGEDVLKAMVLNMAKRDNAYRALVQRSVELHAKTTHTLAPNSDLWAELGKVLLPVVCARTGGDRPAGLKNSTAGAGGENGEWQTLVSKIPKGSTVEEVCKFVRVSRSELHDTENPPPDEFTLSWRIEGYICFFTFERITQTFKKAEVVVFFPDPVRRVVPPEGGKPRGDGDQ